ncbi:hypothetical protein CCOS2040_25155 [Streptomyces albidoflavus]|nr:hypothetical protein CCOS2040_25155 [Streptomyces albidoflavus]
MDTPSDQHAYPAHWEADVVLRDGGTARIRPITADDADRLVSFYEQVSDESKYYRFFAPYPRLSAKDVRRFTHHDHVDRVGLAVTIGGEFIATVRYDRIDDRGMPASAPADEAEVAFLVQDAHQGRGVASALLEHIAAVARERGIRRFTAEVLPANTKMIKVFTDAGYQQKRSFEDGVVRLEFGLEPTDRSLAVQHAREQRAEARSVQRLLAPGSVAVVGVGRTLGGVGRSILRNIREAGFTGPVHAVNQGFPDTGDTVEGVRAHRSVRDIAEPVDLAVIAVPAERVPEAVAECGEHGVQGLVVISAGYAEQGPEGRERQRALIRQARSYGMRVIGPNAFGVINTTPETRLNASLAPELPVPGRVGLFTQSGAIGIALLSALHRDGGGADGVPNPTGVSTFVSAGNRADVSGNDVMQYWYDDPHTDVALMYLETIGNPRKFTRLARRTAAAKPLVVVQGARHSGITPTGHPAPVTRLPYATVSALLRQAGVIRVDTVTELVDVGLLLAGQPLPAGPRVAILGNSESLGLLSYDACLSQGLRPLPPRDLTTDATPEDFRAALAAALADDGCDAVVVTAIPWVGADGVPERPDGEALGAALRTAHATAPDKPVVVVHVELGGLAEALSAAAGTGPGSPATQRGPAPPRPPPTPPPPPPTRHPRPAHPPHPRLPGRRTCRPRPRRGRPVRPVAPRGPAPRRRTGVRVHRRAGRGRRHHPAAGRRRSRGGGRRAARPHPRRRGHPGPPRPLRHRGPPHAPRAGPGHRRPRRRRAGLPGRPQDHRAPPAPPRRPRRGPPRPRRRGPAAPGVRRADRSLRHPGRAAARGAADGAARRRHRGAHRHRPGGRRRPHLRPGRRPLRTPRRHRPPPRPRHRPGRHRDGPLHPHRPAPLRLARLRPGRHPGSGGTAATRLAAGRRPPRGRRRAAGAGGGRPARRQRPRRLGPPRPAPRPRRPRPAHPARVLSGPAAPSPSPGPSPAAGAPP